jgi:hypothetical protein
MWSKVDPVDAISRHFRLEPTKVMYYFDGPQIFCAKFGFIDTVFAKIEDGDDSFLFLAATTTNEIIHLIETGKLSVRGAFLQPYLWVVETDLYYCVTKCWTTGKENVSESMMPEPGVGLHVGSQRLPDTIEQAKAYFSIAFRGASVSTGRMPFSALKSLVDNAYNAARKVLMPTELKGSRSATFDLLVEPTIGSLIISVEKPIISMPNISRRLSSDISKEHLDAKMEEQRDIFFDAFSDFLEMRNSTLSDGIDSRDVVSQFIDVIPGQGTDYASVEFSANMNNLVRTIFIDTNTGDKIHSLLGKDRHERATRVGRIVEINEPSSTFLLSGRNGRIVTCVGSEELFDEPLFVLGNHAEVSGTFVRRPRRDMMYVGTWTLAPVK